MSHYYKINDYAWLRETVLTFQTHTTVDVVLLMFPEDGRGAHMELALCGFQGKNGGSFLERFYELRDELVTIGRILSSHLHALTNEDPKRHTIAWNLLESSPQWMVPFVKASKMLNLMSDASDWISSVYCWLDDPQWLYEELSTSWYPDEEHHFPSGR